MLHYVKGGDIISDQPHSLSLTTIAMAAEIFEKLSNIFSSSVSVKAEEEDEEEEEDLVDPATAIKEACAENNCAALKAKLDECNDRVRGKTKTTETCFEEILDFYHCVDHCAASEIFKHVK